ncbi:FKBP-type peptidyl-prolyl cis-trans isomerase [Parabacteroides faecis]|uniref:FKBP-type peptidyl-prolyl cis-trans isomerase n=1 Tax=Parabacteroides faecis TaxID=1217282 RepID=UPI0021642BB1|nr:FKBP-type peptidyl-prolyl cis-trans isomerase [Parabacteroides faecis]MCS2892917.1 FKBP-type peptidyl-prolyl cis-trans isomerase [Parabacteroides faecis]UVQ48475.1 FKBP-type peptidyl-prolyl cis-trans isomerase [Parabacteroides faecis]
MAKNRKEEYKEQNLLFLEEIALQEGVKKLAGGILYKVTEPGSGTVSPRPDNVVSVHYRGTLIDGREFDNSYERNCPEAFRLNQVIEGWQIALQQMHVGDKWVVYIPYTSGYGNRASGPIPAFSTLIFEVELLGIA